MKKLTTEIFITRSKLIHGDKYDYKLTNYIDSHTKVKIFCNKHKIIFEQLPHNHFKYGCLLCGKESKNNILSMSFETFKDIANKIHNNKYEYNFSVYVNNHTKIKILCKKHGIFEQLPKNHINKKYGCPVCSKNKKMTTDEFIIKSKEIFGLIYDYSNVTYINSNTKVKINCLQHGVFEVTPNNHLCKKYGCPTCKQSKGERNISNFLDKNNINYIKQYKFDNCIDKRKLPFDFYLPDYNTCIEFDGEQHFRINNTWGEKSFLQTQKHDLIKTNFCSKNNIKLIRIKYNEIDLKNILYILKNERGINE